jgi:hypothetical protein
MNKTCLLDEVIAEGHINVLGTHKTTLEVTKEDYLTKRGDCIIGINANKSVKDLSIKLKQTIQEGKQIRIVLKSGSFQDEFMGWGNPNLSLSNPVSIVFRKSNFISNRTILVNCSKASLDIKREIIDHLQDPAEQILIQFYSIA